MAVRGDWSPPRVFDEYEIVRLLGAGGMGEVWVAEDKLLERAVAIKFIAAEPGPEERQRFLVEARAAARLQHPNVVTVHRVGEIDGRPYLVSELVRGQSLAELHAPLPWRRALDLALGLCRGLAAAHRSGVLHRDIKPGNVIIADDGTVKLLDFGIAKLVRSPLATGGSDEVPPPPPPPPATAQVAAPASEESTVRLAHPGPPSVGRGDTPAHLTAAGVVLGTPLYMAPELWRGEPASRASDLYSLGVLLFELCAGTTPFGSLPVPELAARCQKEEPIPLRERAPDADARFAVIVDRCIAIDPRMRPRSADELLDALEQLTPLARGVEVPEGNPYRGLAPFEAQHRALFFGRSGEVRTVLERLRSDPFVLIAGDSGAGKSSVCRAGVLPLIADPSVFDGEWSIARLLPGKSPVAALTSAIAEALGADEDVVAPLLEQGGAALGRSLRKLLGKERGLLVFVDQMEELVTLASREELPMAGEALGRLAAGLPRLKLLGTVRGDFLTRLAAVPGIGYEVARALYIVRRLGPDRIREVIEGPARATGIHFESEELVERLVRSAAASGEGGLPLLQFALAELWEARDRTARVITAASLEAIGGVEGALARHADAVLGRLPAAEQRAARQMLVDLVSAEGTRERRPEAELTRGDGAARRALDALVAARLLVARDVEGVASIELAHEALVRGWSSLRSWLREDEGLRATRVRLEAAASEWGRLGRSREGLWSERQAAEAAPLPVAALAPAAREFLVASRRVHRERRRWRRLAAVAIPLSAVLLWGGLRLGAAHELAGKVDRRLAVATRAFDDARRLEAGADALRRGALERFDAGDFEHAEPLWATVGTTEQRIARLQGRAGDALEAALLLDANAPRVRRRLADLLADRIRFAERTGRESPEELVRRLALYDAGGERRRRLAAPARLRIESTPAAAAVRATAEIGDGAAQSLGPTPVEETPFTPGSWRLAFEAPGLAPLVVPILLRRAERVVVRVPMPHADQVPAGFVAVPPGRFLFGSTEPGLRQDFFHTVPLHEIATGGFLVARHETTFAEWIGYLDALPAAERERRTPGTAGSGGFAGAVALRREPDGRWRLSIQPGTSPLSALAGDPLRIPARARRAVVDWRRLPVVGISFDDAVAFAAWLARTQRVPGARLCDEREWERAARGADGRRYPHGSRLAPDDANIDATYGKDQAALGPDEVGAHPASRSPFGVDDLAGNVWEWTRSAFRPGHPVARGGAFAFDEKTSRSENREEVDPSLRDVSVGMRVCADYPTP